MTKVIETQSMTIWGSNRIVSMVSIFKILNLVWILLMANIGVILALILIELQEVRKMRKVFEHMSGHYEELMKKDTKIFWKDLKGLLD